VAEPLSTGAGHPPDLSPIPALRHNPDFLWLWTGQTASALGSSLAIIVYPILALSLTGSAALAGLVSFLGLSVATVARLPVGVLIDRWPLRPVLVWSDLVRAATTAALVLALVIGRLSLAQLVITAVVNGVAGVFSSAAQSVALRHVVAPEQLPRAFALGDGRSHAVSLVGQPAGGYLYGVLPALPLIADAVSYALSAVLARLIRRPLADAGRAHPVPKLRHDLFTGLRHLWHDSFLKATLLYAAGVQFVAGGLTLALIAAMTADGVTAGQLGTLFAIAAAGGIAGAIATPRLQIRLSPAALVIAMGWVSALAYAAMAWVHDPVVAGLALALVYFSVAPADAMLSAAQVHRTPQPLQGRVFAASSLVAGIIAPLGPLTGGLLIDHTGQAATFSILAAVLAALTTGVQLNRALRTLSLP